MRPSVDLQVAGCEAGQEAHITFVWVVPGLMRAEMRVPSGAVREAGEALETLEWTICRVHQEMLLEGLGAAEVLAAHLADAHGA